MPQTIWYHVSSPLRDNVVRFCSLCCTLRPCCWLVVKSQQPIKILQINRFEWHTICFAVGKKKNIYCLKASFTSLTTASHNIDFETGIFRIKALTVVSIIDCTWVNFSNHFSNPLRCRIYMSKTSTNLHISQLDVFCCWYLDKIVCENKATEHSSTIFFLV